MTQLTQGIPQFGTGMETDWSNKQGLGGLEARFKDRQDISYHFQKMRGKLKIMGGTDR